MRVAFPCLVGSVGVLQRLIDDGPKLLLDVGCGNGTKFKLLMEADRNGKLIDTYFVGLDIFRPYLTRARRFYSGVVQCDVNFLPIRNGSVDVTLCLDLIEHLEKRDGLELLRNLETITRKQLIVFTPVGSLPSPREVIDGNPWQKHRSAWFPQEFRGLGFIVFGVRGVKYIHARSRRWGEYRFKHPALKPLLDSVMVVSQVVTYRLAQMAYQMYCVKRFSFDV